MRIHCAVGILLISVLLAVPTSTGQSPSGPARAADPMSLGATSLTDRLPAEIDWIDPTTRLSEAEKLRLRLWMANLARHDSLEAMEAIPKAAALLTHPSNQGFRPSPDAAVRMVREAVRNRKYETGNLTPKQLVQLPDLSSLDPIARGLKGDDKQKWETARNQALSAIKDSPFLEQHTPRLLQKVPYGSEIVAGIDLLNAVLGDRASIGIDQSGGLSSANYLDDAYARAGAGSFHRSPSNLSATDNRITKAAARLLYAARTNLSAKAIVEDTDVHAMQGLSDQPVEELRGKLTTHFAEVGATVAIDLLLGKRPTPSARDTKQVQHLTKILTEQRAENRRLSEQLKAVKGKVAETPSEARAKADSIEDLTKKRLESSRRARQAAGLAIDCLAALGMDSALLRDLTTLTNAGFQIADGIITLAAGLSNPLGWINILGGLTSLFSFGPNPQQVILEQLGEIRRELAEFRHEVRIQFVLVREEQRSYTQKILDRIEDMEFHLARELGEIHEQVRWNEYRLQQVEGQLSALSHQILTRFAELHQKDLVTLLAARDLDREAFAPLEVPAKRTELLAARYHDALAAAYASAVHHSSSRTLAGGDFAVAGAYGTAAPRLGPGGPGLLLPLVQHPTAPWSNVNDFVGLARSAGISAAYVGLEKEDAGGGAAVGTTGPLSFPPDRSRVVNPLAWALAAKAYLDLATDCPGYFRSRPDYVRGLVEIYRRGEEFNDAIARIAAAPDGGVFQPLIHSQLAAAQQLEKLIRDDADALGRSLGEIDPWKGKDQPLPEGAYVHWLGPHPEWREHMNGQKYDMSGGTNSPKDLGLTEADCKRFFTNGLIHRAFAIAGRIRPEAGGGAATALFGGTVELRAVRVDLADEHIRFRGQWRESTGFLGTGRGKYHGYFLYEGPVYVTFEARYKTPANSDDLPVFRKRVPTRKVVRFRRDDETTYHSFQSAETFARAVRANERIGRKEPLRFGTPEWSETLRWGPEPTGDAPGFQVMPFVQDGWPDLKEDLFNPAVGTLAPKEQLLSPEPVERAIQDRVAFEVFKFESDKDDALKNGLRGPGAAIREVVGCQATIARFVQLVLPEALDDRELQSLLTGDEAAWGGVAIMRRFGGGANRPKLVEGDLQPFKAKDKDGKEIEVKRFVVKDVPLTQTMQAQTLKLQAKLGELLGRRRAAKEPARHPFVEGTLIRLVLTARRLQVPLDLELAANGVAVSPHWVCRQVAALNEDNKEAGR